MRITSVKFCPSLGVIIAAAAGLRLYAAILHAGGWELPDGSADAVKFERIAWGLASLGLAEIWSNFTYNASYYYSLMLAYVYGITGRAPFLAQLLSVTTGVYCVFMTWSAAYRLWGREAARYAAIVTAMMPTLIMYSALTLREVYMSAFLLLGILFVIRWTHCRKYYYALFGIMSFLAGMLFHGGMMAAVIAYCVIVLANAVRQFLQGLARGRIRVLGALVTATLGVVLTSALILNPDLPKIGPVSNLFTSAPYLAVMDNRVYGDAAYPDWLIAQSADQLLWVVPARVLYLFLSPFPWDVSAVRHLVGSFDATIYAALLLMIACNWRAIVKDRAALYVLLILASLVLTFSIGTGNFGAAIRHRSKFLPVLAMLASPVLCQLIRPFLPRPCSRKETQ